MLRVGSKDGEGLMRSEPWIDVKKVGGPWEKQEHIPESALQTAPFCPDSGLISLATCMSVHDSHKHKKK